jgi:hypothetical protein
MRLRLALAVVLVLTGSLAAAATSNESYKDKFESIGWGGSSGSLNWSGPWVEINDDNDEKEGNVRVVSSGECASGNCIQINPLTTLLGGIGARRSADTSVFQEAELCFDIKATGGLSAQLFVEANSGGGWQTLETFNLASPMIDHPEIDITEHLSEGFSLRFRYVGVLLGSPVFIDNVEISGPIVEEEEPTTTTTTVPTTTTTKGDNETTTTTRPRSTTTTTRPGSTTTTTEPTVETTTTTTPTANSIGADLTTTTSTTPDEDGTPTLVAAIGGGDEPPAPGGPGGGVDGSGIRQTARGLQADFDSGLFGQVTAVSPIGVDFDARFSLAAEVIESTWVWMVLLATVIAWSIVSGMERRRSHLEG